MASAMKGFRILLMLTVAALAAPAVAQDELPSAPSAVKQPPPPPPPPPKAEPEPAKTATPAENKPEAQPPAASKGPAGATASSAAPAGKNEGPALETIVKRVDEVNVVFTVTDKHKRFVKNLSEVDFRVLEIGRAHV